MFDDIKTRLKNLNELGYKKFELKELDHSVLMSNGKQIAHICGDRTCGLEYFLANTPQDIESLLEFVKDATYELKHISATCRNYDKFDLTPIANDIDEFLKKWNA